jgi:hypothetical protein
MLRPEIPTLPPPAYLLDEPRQPAGDRRLDDERLTDERQADERQAAA